MTRREPIDLAASVRQRLTNLAHKSHRPFDEVLVYYAIERFLYRPGCSAHADRFLLKGGVLLLTWDLPATRPTRDIDVLARTENSVPNLESILRDVCSTQVDPDGMAFHPDSLVGEETQAAAEYRGVRVRLLGTLGSAKANLRLDVGFGDPVLPQPQDISYPTQLGMPAPRLQGYSRESVIAEKLETMVRLGRINSRMKDFFDIWQLSRAFPYDGGALSDAIEATFRARGTPLNPTPMCLSPSFAEDVDKRTQWHAFVDRSRLQSQAGALPEIVAALHDFLEPPLSALASTSTFTGEWTPPGPWRSASGSGPSSGSVPAKTCHD